MSADHAALLQRYRAVFEQVRDPILLLDEHQLHDVNPAAVALFAAPDRATLLQCPPGYLSVPAPRDGMASADALQIQLMNAREEGQARFAWHFHRWDGTEGIAEAWVQRIDGNGHSLFQLQAYGFTVGEQGKPGHAAGIKNEAILEQGKLEQDLVEGHPLMVGRFLPDSTITFVNPSLAELYGTDPEGLKGQRWLDLLPSEQEKEAAQAHLDRFTPQEPVHAFEHTMPDAEGEIRWLQWTNRAFFGARGELTHFQSIGMDVTKRRAAEQARKQLTEIIENTPDLVSIAHPEGEILYMNRAGRHLLGQEAPPEQAPVKGAPRVADRAAHPDWASRLIRNVGVPTAVAEGYWESETAILEANGEEIPMSQVILAHHDENGEVVRLSTIMRDLRPQKRLQEALDQRQRWLSQLQGITSTPHRPLAEKLAELLKLGTRAFDLPYAILGRIDDVGYGYTIRAATSPDDSLQPGQCLELEPPGNDKILATDGPVGLHHVGNSAFAPTAAGQGIEAYLRVPIQVGDSDYGTLLFYGHEPREPFTSFESQLLQLMGQWLTYELTREASRSALAYEATTDHLTGLYNRQHFDAELDRSLAHQERYARSTGLILFDIDHFKALNDAYGHTTGDRVLTEVAQRALGLLRDPDLFARWGGEEFAIVAPETDAAGACHLAERLRAYMAAEPFTEAGPVSISVGATQLHPQDDKDSALQRADHALYQAKREGRNQVVHNPPQDAGDG